MQQFNIGMRAFQSTVLHQLDIHKLPKNDQSYNRKINSTRVMRLNLKCKL